MKTTRYIFWILLILYSTVHLIGGEYYVKFAHSSKYIDMINNGKEIELFQKSFGEYSIKPILKPEQIKYFKRKQDNVLHSSVANFELDRVYILKNELPNNEILARKLSNYNDIEYFEVVPEISIQSKPNDPLLSKQWYFDSLKIADAWKLYSEMTPMLVSVIDTGFDLEHEDFAGVFYINQGENGKDRNGKDKRSNGIDDDGNGFVDDWLGWDFAGIDGNSPDNSVSGGHNHGTHVLGIISARSNNNRGIAGLLPSVKVLPLKVGKDDEISRTTHNAYEAILYAAVMGAKVINCSWGTLQYSQTHNEIIQNVNKIGALVVAAAGNDGSQLDYYPASYPKVLSVSSVDKNNYKSTFANYSSRVDLVAPGTGIFSTFPKNKYENSDGTSMATPIVSAVAAMLWQKYPKYTPNEIKAHLKASSKSIDFIQNPIWQGKLGQGIIAPINALNKSNFNYIELSNIISKNIFDSQNEKLLGVLISCQLHNVLEDIDLLEFKVSNDYSYNVELQKANDNFQVINLKKGEKRQLVDFIKIDFDNEVLKDTKINLKIECIVDNNIINSYLSEIVLLPSYKNLTNNHIKTTINSKGNIGYNDFPKNKHGLGFRYLNSNSLIFEGSLMIAIAPDKIVDVARGESQTIQNQDFNIVSLVNQEVGYDDTEKLAKAVFADGNPNSKSIPKLGVEIIQSTLQSNRPEYRKHILVSYDIINNSNENYDSLYCALFLDWDIGKSVLNNTAYYDNRLNAGIAYNPIDKEAPCTATLLLSPHRRTFFALDNDGTGPFNPGIYDGFTTKEKWFTMSNGISRKETNLTDISMVVGAGPIKLAKGDTTRVAFALVAGDDREQLRKNVENAVNHSNIRNWALSPYATFPTNIGINVFPNPLAINNVVKIDLSKNTDCRIYISDNLGREKIEIYDGELNAGKHEFTFDTNFWANGNYFIVLEDNENTFSKLLLIAR